MNRYTHEADRKFYKDAQIRYFPGNTIICFLEPNTGVYREALICLSRFLTCSFSYKYSILPPPSFHMTVFDLVAGDKAFPEELQKRIGRDFSMEETDEYFEQHLSGIEAPAEIRMRYRMLVLDRYFTICLEPATEQVSNSITSFRKTLSGAAGIPLKENYTFHISLAYLVIHLNEQEKTERDKLLAEMHERLANNLGEFTLPAPRLVFFDTMYAFYTDKYKTFRWMK